jgi:hypothetical protein
VTIKANNLPSEQGDGNGATVVAFDAEVRRRTQIDHGGSPHRRAPAAASARRVAVRSHPMVKKAALKSSLQRALKLVAEDRLDEADLELGAYARIRRER